MKMSEIFNPRVVVDANPYNRTVRTILVGDDVLGVPFFIFGVTRI